MISKGWGKATTAAKRRGVKIGQHQRKERDSDWISNDQEERRTEASRHYTPTVIRDDVLSQPYRSSSGATVESELHVSVHQVDGQKVPAGRVVAVEQRPVRRGRAECHLKLNEGQVTARGLRPGDDGVRKHRLVEERRGQREICRGESVTVRAGCKCILNIYQGHAVSSTVFANGV